MFGSKKLERRLEKLEEKLLYQMLLRGKWSTMWNDYVGFGKTVDLRELDTKVDLLLDRAGLKLVKVHEHYELEADDE